MFRSNDLRKYCHVSAQSWPGGLYGTANLSGSRPGCLSAGAWVTIMTIGREGYVEYTKRIIEATLQLSKAKVWGLELMGNPQLCVVAFTSKKYNPLILCTMLEEKGWGMSSMHLPNAFHFCVT